LVGIIYFYSGILVLSLWRGRIISLKNNYV
jgi:hypothetical protein